MQQRTMCDVAAVEYTGYPGSPEFGETPPSEAALYDDADTALAWLAASVAEEAEKDGGQGKATPAAGPPRVVLYGHSLGSALALHAATGAPDVVAGVIVEAPFLSAIRTRMDYVSNPLFASASSYLSELDLFDNAAMAATLGAQVSLPLPPPLPLSLSFSLSLFPRYRY